MRLGATDHFDMVNAGGTSRLAVRVRTMDITLDEVQMKKLTHPDGRRVRRHDLHVERNFRHAGAPRKPDPGDANESKRPPSRKQEKAKAKARAKANQELSRSGPTARQDQKAGPPPSSFVTRPLRRSRRNGIHRCLIEGRALNSRVRPTWA